MTSPHGRPGPDAPSGHAPGPAAADGRPTAGGLDPAVVDRPGVPGPVVGPPVDAATAGGSAEGDGSGPAQGSDEGGGIGAVWDGVLDHLDRWQRRWVPTAFVTAVIRKFSHDRAGQQAALVAYYGFFSVFPLLLAFVSILGFVLEGDPELKDRIQEAALDEIPLGNLTTDIETLTGSTFVVVAGLLAALWAGTAAAQAAQNAMNDVWTVPMVERPNIVFRRLRALGTMVAVGGGIVLSTAVGEILASLSLPGGARVLAFAANWLVNAIVFLLAYQLLVDLPLRWRHVAIGAAVGAVGYQLLQRLGRLYVENLVGSERINDFYGSLAGVIGLLTWLHLLAQLAIFCAEVNVVAVRRLWPRSITGRHLTAADRRAFRDTAAIHQLVKGAEVHLVLPGEDPGPEHGEDPGPEHGEDPGPEHGPEPGPGDDPDHRGG
ncbi:MAG: YhjD/YihY/BrkB family envelope integrity protein, partial [Actinomycetota bacterium]|nr:YhjD/YihY/BrkB family envelope integrity protein [Actinomycetota bacterium]